MTIRHALRFSLAALAAALLLPGCGQATSPTKFSVGGGIVYDQNGNPIQNSVKRLDFFVDNMQHAVNLKSFILAQFQSALNTNIVFEISDATKMAIGNFVYDPSTFVGGTLSAAQIAALRQAHVYAVGTTLQSVDIFEMKPFTQLQQDSFDPTGKTFIAVAGSTQSFNARMPASTYGPKTSDVGTFDATSFVYAPPNQIYSDPLSASPAVLDTFNLWIEPQDTTLTPSYVTMHLNLGVTISPNAPSSAPLTIPANTATAPNLYTQQFTAYVPGDGVITSGPLVTWQATDASGTPQPLIDQNGLFTAPQLSQGSATYTIKATSITQSDKFATATITVNATNTTLGGLGYH